MPRLFFAVWPDAEAAKRLATLAGAVVGRIGGRAVPADNIHLTLAFLGDVPEERVPQLESIARSVPGRIFNLRLDRLGSFKQARVGWIGCEAMHPDLVALERELAQGLRAAGFGLDDRPFAPHVTLARKIERRLGPEATEPIEWRANAFELVRTEFGKGRYSRLAAFTLE
jgi:2'-5' RNA ligase